MKKKDIEKHLSIYITRLYSFAYCLIPDELQAQQLVLDAYYVVSLKYKDRLDNLLGASSELKGTLARDLLITIYRQIMDIAVKREQHLHHGLCNPTEYDSFFKQTAKERATLFLKHKSDLSMDEIGMVLGEDRFGAIASLSVARNNILKSDKLKKAAGQ